MKVFLNYTPKNWSEKDFLKKLVDRLEMNSFEVLLPTFDPDLEKGIHECEIFLMPFDDGQSDAGDLARLDLALDESQNRKVLIVGYFQGLSANGLPDWTQSLHKIVSDEKALVNTVKTYMVASRNIASS